MKKIMVWMLAAALAASCTACGTGEAQNPDTAEQSSAADAQNSDADEQTVSVAPLALLTTVWESYSDEEVFPVIGGDLSEEHVTENAPGFYSIEDAEVMDNALGYPAASVSLIDEAASITHMMNANTFTCSAYHLVNAGDIETVKDAIHENIKNRQWICGFPEQLVIASVGDDIVMLFGTTDLVGQFKDKMTAAYPDAAVLCDEPI